MARNTLGNFGFCTEAQPLIGTTRVHAAAWLSPRAWSRPTQAVPSKPVSPRINSGEITNSNLAAGAEVDRLGPVVLLGGQYDAFRGIVHIEEIHGWPCRFPRPSPFSAPANRASSHLRTKAGITWLLRGVEIVAWPVGIDRQHVDRIEPVLPSDRPAPGPASFSLLVR